MTYKYRPGPFDGKPTSTSLAGTLITGIMTRHSTKEVEKLFRNEIFLRQFNSLKESDKQLVIQAAKNHRSFIQHD